MQWLRSLLGLREDHADLFCGGCPGYEIVFSYNGFFILHEMFKGYGLPQFG